MRSECLDLQQPLQDLELYWVVPDLARETNSQIWTVIIDIKKENGNINLQVHLEELLLFWKHNVSAYDHDESNDDNWTNIRIMSSDFLLLIMFHYCRHLVWCKTQVEWWGHLHGRPIDKIFLILYPWFSLTPWCNI